MKKIIFILIVANSFLFNSAKAQNKTEVSLEDLKMPTSPAFILLDVAPTSIDRPTTTKAFSTSILNSISKNNGVPENYAVDFAPYWFFKHNKLTAKNYWGYKKKNTSIKQTPFSQARFGNISFATVKSEIKTDNVGSLKEVSNIAIGIRTTLFQLRASKVIKEIDEWNAKHVTQTSKLSSDPNLSAEELIEKLEEDNILNLCNEKISSLIERRPVLALDIAGAGSWSFEADDYNSIDRNRAGVWLTLNFAQSLNNEKNKSKNDFLNLYATARLLNTNNVLSEDGEFISSSVFDSGGKVELELDKFSFSYEYLYRNNTQEKLSDSFRSSGMIKYRASEQLLVTATFGKNFGDYNNVITQIGLSWGLSNKNQSVIK